MASACGGGARAARGWLLGAAVAALGALGQVSGGDYYAKPQAIRTNVGTWDVAFDPDALFYRVDVGPGTQAVTVNVFVDYTKYASASNAPLVAIDGEEERYSRTSPASRKISLGNSSHATSRNVTVVVAGPPDQISNFSYHTTFRQTRYEIRLSRAADLDAILEMKALIIEDDGGNVVATSPPFETNTGARHFDAFVPLKTERVRVAPVCTEKAHAIISGPGGVQDAPAWMPVHATATHTIVNAACQYGSDKRGVAIDIQALVDLDDVVRRLRLRLLGDNGEVKRYGNSFVVSATAKVVQLVALFPNTRVSLLLEVPSEGSYIMKVSSPSPPLEVPDHGNRTLSLVLRSGDRTERLPVVLSRFVEPPVPIETLHSTKAESMGTFVAVATAGSLGTSGLAAFAAAATGRGGLRDRALPVILRSLTLLLQFAVLSNVADGPCVWTDFLQPLRWLCLTPPMQRFAGTGALVTGLRSAEAARVLTRAGSILLMTALVRLLLRARWSCGRCSHFTLPHRLRLGNWEAHCLSFVLYPMSTAAVSLLLKGSPQASVHELTAEPDMLFLPTLPVRWWMHTAGISIAASTLFAVMLFCRVSTALWHGYVIWIPRVPNEESSDGESAQEHGFYCDASCDQISTRHVERALCGLPFLTMRWAVTVADIRPVDLGSGSAAVTEEAYLLVGVESEGDTEDEWLDASPVPAVHVAATATAVDVEVVGTVRLAGGHSEICCAEVGRVPNVTWLEAHISAEGLIRLHQEVNPLVHDWATPVRVRAEQLEGPITTGALSFCFDGFRWPLLPPLELMLRLALGATTAASAVGQPAGRVLPLLAAAALSTGTFLLVLHEAPCSYVTENSMALVAHIGLSVVAMANVAHAVEIFSLRFLSAVLVLVIGCAVALLLLHALLTAAALGSAVACPMGFEEDASSLETCNVDLALRGPGGSWVLLTPAECKLSVKTFFVHALPASEGNVEVHCTGDLVQNRRPRLEFPVLDYLSVEHPLEPPLLVFFGKARDVDAGPEQYRAECVYADEDVQKMVVEFIRRGHLPSVEYAPEIAGEVCDLTRQQAGPGRILSVVLVPVPRLQAPGRDELEDEELGGDEGEREALITGPRRTSAPGAWLNAGPVSEAAE